MPGLGFSITRLTRNMYQLSLQTTSIFIKITFVVNSFSKLFFHFWLSRPPQFQFLLRILLSSWPSFWKTYPSTEDNVDSLSPHLGLLSHPISVLVIHKNVPDHCFSFTQSNVIMLTFAFLETSIHRAQSFTNYPIQQSDPFIIYLPIPKHR